MNGQQFHTVLLGATSKDLWILSWLLFGSYQCDSCIHISETRTPGTPSTGQALNDQKSTGMGFQVPGSGTGKFRNPQETGMNMVRFL